MLGCEGEMALEDLDLSYRFALHPKAVSHFAEDVRVELHLRCGIWQAKSFRRVRFPYPPNLRGGPLQASVDQPTKNLQL